MVETHLSGYTSNVMLQWIRVSKIKELENQNVTSYNHFNSHYALTTVFQMFC